MNTTISREQALAGSPDDKANYMKSLRFEHPTLNAVRAKVRNLRPTSGLSITMVVGPTGVGKTTFGKLQLEDLLESYGPELQEDPSSIPVVLSEVDPADGKEINWVLFYQRVCSDLLSPCSLDGSTNVPTSDPDSPLDLVRSSRLMFERALKNRKVRHLILDEAVHFTKSGTDPLQYGNLLKSLSNRAGMNLLLLGAYGCEDIVLSSDQLARRITVVHFKRYHNTEEDFRSYGQFVKSIVTQAPLFCPIDIAQHLQHLFVGTCGLPGLTVDVLVEAVRSCAEGGGQWHSNFLFEAMPSLEAQRKIAKETVVGERKVEGFLRQPRPQNYVTDADIDAELLKEEANRRQRSESRAS